MNPNVQTSHAIVEIKVESYMTAELDGREIHPVYSTFWLAKHAETAARRAIEPYFDAGENAVGGELSLRHEAMAAVGAAVKIYARVQEARLPKIVCGIEAWCGNTRIASGSQVQIVLPDSRIRELVAAACSTV